MVILPYNDELTKLPVMILCYHFRLRLHPNVAQPSEAFLSLAGSASLESEAGTDPIRDSSGFCRVI